MTTKSFWSFSHVWDGQLTAFGVFCCGIIYFKWVRLAKIELLLSGFHGCVLWTYHLLRFPLSHFPFLFFFFLLIYIYHGQLSILACMWTVTVDTYLQSTKTCSIMSGQLLRVDNSWESFRLCKHEKENCQVLRSCIIYNSLKGGNEFEVVFSGKHNYKWLFEIF